jgi:hypothetical protein
VAILSWLEALFRKPAVEAFLALAILLVGIGHELVDTTALGVAGIEAHHGLVAIGAQHFLKVSQDVSDSLELAEDAAEEDVS